MGSFARYVTIVRLQQKSLEAVHARMEMIKLMLKRKRGAYQGEVIDCWNKLAKLLILKFNVLRWMTSEAIS